MRTLLAAPLALAIALAGCISSSQPAVEPASLPPADAVLAVLPGPIGLHGCAEQAAVLPVPAQFVEGELPEGFALATMGPGGSMAAIFVTGYRCGVEPAEEGFAALDHSGMDEVSEFAGILLVVPPEEYKVEGEDAIYGLAYGIITSSEAHKAAYEQIGMPTFLGEVDIGYIQETPVARIGHVLAPDEEMTFHLYSTVAGPADSVPAGLARIFLAEEGKLLPNVLDVTWTEAQIQEGEATFRMEGNMMPPAEPGIAIHWWGEEYNVLYTFNELPAQAGEPAEAQPLRLPARFG